MRQNRKIWEIVIPIIVAIAVICTLAICGHINKTDNSDEPVIESGDGTEELTEVSTEPVISQVTLVAVGDNLIHNTLIDAGVQDDGTLDYSSFYSNIKSDISDADIAVINQETMLGGSEFEYTGYPLFNTPWEVGDAAIDAGFDIFTCATNHALDVGYSGIEAECEFFSEHKDVLHVGTNISEEAYNTVSYYTKNNIKFAILNYTYGTNGISLPSGKEWCVDMMDEEKITADVKEAKQNADVVIVFPHWGTENSSEVSSYQTEYTELFSQLGVDIVIGCHPHVLQDAEWVKNEETGKKMLVYYSLGNFISHQVNLEQLCGGMAKITITKKDDEINIDSAELIPLVCWYSTTSSGKYEFSVYKLSDYTDSLASSHAQSGASAEYFTQLAQNIVSDEFLTIS